MHFIFDNIVASMVGAVILLVMVATHHRNQLASVEATSYYMLQQQVLSFTSTIQRDMQNLSSIKTLKNRPDSTDSQSVTKFVFRAQTSPTDTTKHEITYWEKKVGIRKQKNGTNVMLRQITRLVDGVVTGGSIATITDWRVQALNEAGTDASSFANTKQLRVSFAAASPISVETPDGVTIRDTRWESTFRPRMLRDDPL